MKDTLHHRISLGASMTYLQRRVFLKAATALGMGTLVVGARWERAKAQTLPSVSDLDFLGEPGRWNSYSREREPTCDVIQAVEFTLSQTTLGAGSDTVIAADVVTIDGLVKTKGRHITIAARRIICNEGSAIDTSGSDGTSRTDAAAPGDVLGAAGKDGEKGDDGEPAGNVSLYTYSIDGRLLVTANGGNGAQGQKGGTGAQGKNGGQGAAGSRRSRPGTGGSGGKGGTAGSGGTGGDGGQAGGITCYVSTEPEFEPTLVANGGNGGQEGEPGSPGKRGLGGNPGDPCFTYYQPRGPDHAGGEVNSCWERKYWAPAGEQGPVGDEATQINSPGVVQPAKTPVLQMGDSSKIFEFFSITTLAMGLYRCELDMLNGDYAEVEARASWISACAASATSGRAFYEGKRQRLGTAEVGEASRAELDAMSGQAGGIASNIRLGFDAFGHAPQFVSDLTPEFLKEQSQEWIGIATTLQAAYLSLLSQNTSLEEKSRALQSGRSAVNASITAGDQAIRSNEQRISVIQTDILALVSCVADLQRQIELTDQQFRNDVSGRGGCSLENMISFVVGVVAIAAAVYTGYGALVGAMATANAGGPSAGRGIQGVIDDFRVLGDSFKKADLQSHLNEMRQGFQQASDALKTDRTKLVVSLEAFEEQLKPFMDMPSAVRYRDLLRQLVDVAQAKNMKQVELTQIVYQNDRERLEQVSRQMESDRIGRLVASTNNPALTECVVFLGRFLEQTKRNILRVTDLQRRGLTYLTCVTINLSYRTSRVEELSVPQAQLGDAWLRALQEQAGSRQEMVAEFELARSSHSRLFDALAKIGRAEFAIPTDHPTFNRGGTAYLRAASVDLKVNTFPASVQEFTCRLTHSGASLVRDRAGRAFTFLHSRRPTNLSYERLASNEWQATTTVERNLRGDEKFIQLSPFTTWLLEFEAYDALDWTGVDALRFEFKVSFIPSDRTYEPENVFQSIRLQ